MINTDFPRINLLPHLKLRNSDERALVDYEDHEALKDEKWYLNNCGYVQRSGGKPPYRTSMIHRLIMDTPKGLVTHHVNRDKLDNRKENLEVCTYSENQWVRGTPKSNTSGYKGVRKTGGKWQVYLATGGFNTPEEAALEYNRIAKIMYGEYAHQNKIKKGRFPS